MDPKAMLEQPQVLDTQFRRHHVYTDVVSLTNAVNDLRRTVFSLNGNSTKENMLIFHDEAMHLLREVNINTGPIIFSSDDLLGNPPVTEFMNFRHAGSFEIPPQESKDLEQMLKAIISKAEAILHPEKSEG